MRLLFLLFLSTSCLLVNGQSLLDGEPKWYVRNTDIFWGPSPYPKRSLVYRIGYTDTINSVTHHHVEVSFDSLETNWQPTDFSLYQKGDTIFSFFSEFEMEEIFLIYNWEVSHFYMDCWQQEVELKQVDTILSAGNQLIYYNTYESHPDGGGVLEGIGHEDFMFPLNGYCATDQGEYDLRCFYRNDTLIYQKDPNIPCFEPSFDPTNTTPTHQTLVHLRTNILNTGQEIIFDHLEEGTIQIIDSNGYIESVYQYPSEIPIAKSSGHKLIRVITGDKTTLLRLVVIH